MFTETSPISVAVKPASTQNGFTMNPIDASPSLKIRMNTSTGQMCGRAISSMSAPNIGPRVASVFAAGTRRLPSQHTASAANAVPSAIPQNAGTRATTSSPDRRARARRARGRAPTAASFGSVTMRASSARSAGLRVALDRRAPAARRAPPPRTPPNIERRARESARPRDPVGEDQHQPRRRASRRGKARSARRSRARARCGRAARSCSRRSRCRWSPRAA